MNELRVACNACGTSLRLHQSTKYATCNHCNTLLEVVQTPESCYTIEKNNDSLAPLQTNNPAHSNAQIYAEIELLDSAWNNQLPTFMLNGTLPTTDGGLTLFARFFGIIFGIIWTISLVVTQAPIIFYPVGILMVIFSIWSFANHDARTTKYVSAKNKYEKARQKLQAKIIK